MTTTRTEPLDHTHTHGHPDGTAVDAAATPAAPGNTPPTATTPGHDAADEHHLHDELRGSATHDDDGGLPLPGGPPSEDPDEHPVASIAGTGAGAAVGAIAGGIVAGPAGAVVGAVTAGVAGGAVAHETADRYDDEDTPRT